MKIFSLGQVTQSIQKTLSSRYTSSFWVAAEMNRLGYQPNSGHAFPELVEKIDGKITAQMKAFILKSDMRFIAQKFRSGTGEELRDNIKILFLAEIAYSPLHGLSLQIKDIDPNYTIGDLERERQDCIQRLKKEGLYELNKTRHFSLAPKSIAVISSNTSKGFEDFIHTLAKALPDIAFRIELFGAALQGSEAPSSIINQLESIKLRYHQFDAVAIIRGGGGDVGLSCYNDYLLASTVSSFPIPVFTGVGHKANETVVELVSFGAGITPTAVGEIFVQRCQQFLNSINQLNERMNQHVQNSIRSARILVDNSSIVISRMAMDVLRNQKQYLSDSAHRLIRDIHHSLHIESRNIQSIVHDVHHYSLNSIHTQHHYIKLRALPVLRNELTRAIKNEREHVNSIKAELPIKTKGLQAKITDDLKKLETIVRLNNPESILRKGYSITKVNGTIIGEVGKLKQGDTMVTQFIDGTTTSIIQQINQPHE